MKTLNNILKSFQRNITELDKLIESDNNKVSQNETRVAELNIESAELNDNINRATAVRNNIAALIKAN